MGFKVTILGCSSALPTTRRNTSSQILNIEEQYYMIDCGEGVQKSLRHVGINALRINCIFISHTHGDHVFGLFGLLSSMGMLGRKNTLNIYGPDPIQEIVDFYLKTFDPQCPYTINVTTVSMGDSHKVYENNNFEVYSIPLRHKIATVGYLFREKEAQLNIHKEKITKYDLTLPQIASAKSGNDIELSEEQSLKSGYDKSVIIPNQELTFRRKKRHSYCYISDTLYSNKAAERIVDILKGDSDEEQKCDVLYHESTFMSKDSRIAHRTGHSTSIEAAKFATNINAKSLFLGHYSTRYKDLSPMLEEAKNIFTETYLTEDFMTINIYDVK